MSELCASLPVNLLKKAVQTALRAVLSKSGLPILTFCRIKAHGEGISILATDLEIWVEAKLSAPPDAPGEVAVPAKWLSELLGKLPTDALVLLRQEGTVLHLKCGGAKYKVLGLPADEFPVLPSAVGVRFPFAAPVLAGALSRSLYAASKDQMRAVLCGGDCHFSLEGLKIACSDTHRLAIAACPLHLAEGMATDAQEIGSGAETHALIPATSLLQMRAMLDGARRAFLSVTQAKTPGSEHIKTFFRAEVEGEIAVTLYSRLIDGQAPNFERVIPAHHDGTITCQRQPLIDAVERALLVARDSARRVVVTPGPDVLTLSAESVSTGSADEVVDCIQEGQTGAFCADGHYLLEALKALDGEGVRFEVPDSPLLPFVLRGTGDAGENDTVVLMPMQIV